MRFKAAMLRRGLLSSWAQFIAVFCMATLSVLAYAGLEGGWRGMQVSLQDYAESSSMADMWIQATSVSEAQLDEAMSLPGVDAVEKRVIRSAEGSSVASRSPPGSPARGPPAGAIPEPPASRAAPGAPDRPRSAPVPDYEIGRASCRERV